MKSTGVQATLEDAKLSVGGGALFTKYDHILTLSTREFLSPFVFTTITCEAEMNEETNWKIRIFKMAFCTFFWCKKLTNSWVYL